MTGTRRTAGTSPEDGSVEVEQLTRRFRVRGGKGLALRRTEVVAVDALTFAVGAGESVGYIGANGAGKSTTIKMLAGILVPSAMQWEAGNSEPI